MRSERNAARFATHGARWRSAGDSQDGLACKEREGRLQSIALRAALRRTAGVADRDNVARVPQGHAPFALFNGTANPVVRAVLGSPRGNRRVGLAHARGDERTGVTVEVQLAPDLG